MLLCDAPMSGAVFTSNDIRSLSAALNAISDPGQAPDIFQSIINPTHLAPCPNAIQARSQGLRRYLVLGAGAGGGLILLLYSMPLLGVLAISGAWYVFKRLPDNTSALETAKNTAEAGWNTACQDWQAKTGNQSYLKIRSDGLNAIKELAELPDLETRLIQELNHKRHELQLVAFLQKYRIDRAKIRNVGAGRRLQLASYGIETAADITKQRVLAISGFGNAIANSLVAWRRSVEAKFIFSAAAPIDPKEIANVKAQILKQKASKVAEVRRLIRQFDSVVVDIKSRRRPMQHALQARYRALKQAECDFNAAKFAPQVPSPLVIICIILGVALLGGLLLKSVGRLEQQPKSPDISRPILTPKSTPQEETTASTSESPPKTDKWLSGNATSPQNVLPPPTNPEPNSTNFVGFVPDEPTSPSPPPTPLQMPKDVIISTEPAGELENTQKPSELQSPSSAKLNPDSREDAKKIQQRLIELGYASGVPDGMWGKLSQAALKAFQTASGLPTTGNWDLATENLLFADSAPANRRSLFKKAEPSGARPFQWPGRLFGEH